MTERHQQTELPRPPAAGNPAARRPSRSFDTAELFGSEAEIEIVHEQTVYRLKITRQGKLILNK